ncbi:MAG: exodeoxyribonuclease III [Kofleriaceae bacterium]|nr:exodeoxyribonuclease III [Myxococcales bacterium]MCB9570693.1 exodeoxyribonuclease III [Kofleriaceae bacterium]
MKLATWNVNSIRARHDRVVAWLADRAPDVLCLQEIKVETDAFPRDAFEAAGWHLAIHGQKTYNGVAIASRTPISDVEIGLGDDDPDDHARLIAGTVDGVRVVSAYFPNGGEVGSDKYAYKLRWMARLRAWLERRDPAAPLALCGDYNVAPDDRDVWDPAAWAGQTLCTDAERAALAELGAWGLRDTFRKHHDDGGLYSWWDYRRLSFPKKQGLRIDHVWVTASLYERCVACDIDRDARKGKDASDHAPVIAEFSA